MDFNINITGTSCEIVLSGKFSFADRQSFKKLFDEAKEKKLNKINIDLKGIDFVDSAALGILLYTREEAKKYNAEIILKHPTGQVKKMFEISKFYELFTIVE